MILSPSAVAVCCWRFGEIGRAPAQFVEQPRVLDGDDGLAGEIGEQRDLFIREGTNFLTEDRDDPNQFIVLEHRHIDCGPNATKLDQSTTAGWRSV